MNQKGQVSIEFILILTLVILLSTLYLPPAIQFYYGAHADTLVKSKIVRLLGEKSLQDNTKYRIDSLTSNEADVTIAYTIFISPEPPLETQQEIGFAVNGANGIKEELLKQTNKENVTITIHYQE